MCLGRPAFSAKTEEDQLDVIFKALGTPDQTTFPGWTELPKYAVRTRHAPRRGLLSRLRGATHHGEGVLCSRLP